MKGKDKECISRRVLVRLFLPFSVIEILLLFILHGKTSKTIFLKANKRYHRDSAKLDAVVENEAKEEL